MKSIFLLEDNESLGKSLEDRLTQEGYKISWAATIADARKKFISTSFDLAILDVALPDGNGFEFARELVKPRGTPIVFLSAFSTAEYRLEGYDSGGTEYIPKPFHLRELLLRVKKVLETERTDHALQFGTLAINTESMSISIANGEPQFLARRDFELLHFLIKSSPRAVSREEILTQVWGDDHTGTTTRTVDNTIVRLRQVLGAEGTKRIRSVRRLGYQWTA